MTHPFAEEGPQHLVEVGRAEDWGEGQSKDVKVHKKPMTVARIGDRFFAVNSICPHMGGPLSCGNIAEGKVHCPWHDWSFDLATGESANGHRIDRYRVVVEDGVVKVGWILRD